MSKLTLRYLKGSFRFESRRDTKDWRLARHPGSPIDEIGADSVSRRCSPRDRRTAAVNPLGTIPHLRASPDTAPPAN